MKNLILVTALLLTSVVSQAATYGSEQSITGIVGFTQSAPNFGANYERRIDNNMGVGGYFHFASEQKNGFGKNQTMSFGAMAPMHLLDNSRADVYLAPGFGITMVKGITGTLVPDDQTIFGPIWKVGAMFKMTSSVKLGLEQTHITNWFTDKLPSDMEYTNFAVNFAF